MFRLRMIDMSTAIRIYLEKNTSTECKFERHSGKKEFAKGKISENDISVFD